MSVETTNRPAESPPSSLERSAAAIRPELEEMRDAISVGRVFGEAYESNGVTVIPVARIAGGAGGGGGEGVSKAESGGGFGSGIGLGVRPVGVVTIDRDGRVRWRPTVDATRIARSGQVLAGIIAVCVTLILLRRN